jgi:hypothetical protein
VVPGGDPVPGLQPGSLAAEYHPIDQSISIPATLIDCPQQEFCYSYLGLLFSCLGDRAAGLFRFVQQIVSTRKHILGAFQLIVAKRFHEPLNYVSILSDFSITINSSISFFILPLTVS